MPLSIKSLVAALMCASCLSSAFASEPSAAGRWIQVDERDGFPRSIIRIEERQGEFEGYIERVFPYRPGDPDVVCEKCSDSRKGQKLLGMKIITGLRRNANRYESGQILDPGSGSIYQAKMTLSADGKTLEVRGFVGISLLGRSQTWLRD